MKRKIIIMMKFNREEGLTLIELLITIAVLAIVAAIAVPVVTNVVAGSNANALAQTNSDVADFINKYNNSGVVGYDVGTQTLYGYVDLDGNNSIAASSSGAAFAPTTDAWASGELVETLTIDTTKFGPVSQDVDIAPSNFSAAAVTPFTFQLNP